MKCATIPKFKLFLQLNTPTPTVTSKEGRQEIRQRGHLSKITKETHIAYVAARDWKNHKTLKPKDQNPTVHFVSST